MTRQTLEHFTEFFNNARHYNCGARLLLQDKAYFAIVNGKPPIVEFRVQEATDNPKDDYSYTLDRYVVERAVNIDQVPDIPFDQWEVWDEY